MAGPPSQATSTPAGSAPAPGMQTAPVLTPLQMSESMMMQPQDTAQSAISTTGSHSFSSPMSMSSISVSPHGQTPSDVAATPALCTTPAMSTLVMRSQKPIRSVFGCTTCKKRKVKCDEKRPRCGNCSKKSGRECVYLYEVAPWARGPEDMPIPLVTVPPGTVIPSGAAVPMHPHHNHNAMAGPSKLPGQGLDQSPAHIRHPIQTHATMQMPPAQPSLQPRLLSQSPSGSLPQHSVIAPIPRPNIAPAPIKGPGIVTDSNTLAGDSKIVALQREAERADRPRSTLELSSLLGPLTGRPSRESLARYVEAHGMTWFIEASEAIDQERYSSQQKRTYSERRQTVLAYCWDTYLGYQGKFPLELAEVKNDLTSLGDTGLLYSFVAVGAFTYGYWSKFRKMPSEEHYSGARAMGDMSIEAAALLIPEGPNEEYPSRDIEKKFLLTISMFVCYAAPAADRLAWKAMHLLGHLARFYGGVEGLCRHLDEEPVTQMCTVDVISGSIVDMAQSLIRGIDTSLIPSTSYQWLEEHPIAQRVVPEGFGYSVPMAKLAYETIAVLYGRFSSDTVSPSLKTLYRTLSTTSLVTVYSSPQPPRVQTGDLLIRHCLFSLIYIDGFRLGPDDDQVRRTSDTILELFSEALCNGMYTIRWLLSMIVGSCLCAPDRRPAVLDIYDSMAATCGCDDIGVARRLTQEVWSRRDAGRADWNWRHVIKDNVEMDILYI